MDIVSGFNHQFPGDNDKPMIYHEGEDTYVLNKTTGADGEPLYYGTELFGRTIKLSNGVASPIAKPVIALSGNYDSAGLSLRQLRIGNQSDYDINLSTDFATVFFESSHYTCPVCIMSQYEPTKYALVAFDLAGSHIVAVSFRCDPIIRSGSSTSCDIIDSRVYDISSLRM